MADHDDATTAPADGEAEPGGRVPRWAVLLGILVALAGGLLIAGVATALTPESDDCPGGSAGLQLRQLRRRRPHGRTGQ
jgi:hypothetical protein